jgi:glycosyltransferase involved in cell wall biosynthesis
MTKLNDAGEVLTVIIPVANMAGNLKKLRSTLMDGGTFGIQFRIIHDFQDSTTSSELRELIADFADSNIELTEGKFGSPGAARNVGLNLVNREWVAFWDSDDLPHVKEFMSMLNQATLENSDIAIGSFEIFSDVDNLLIGKNVLPVERSKALVQIASKPGIWRFAFRARILNGIEFPNLRMAEDQVFLARLNISCFRVTLSKEIVYRYFSGGPNHLTSRKEVMGDLLIAANITKSLTNIQLNGAATFSLELLIRQLTSALIHGGIEVRAKAFMKILSLFSIQNIKKFKSIVIIFARLLGSK